MNEKARRRWRISIMCARYQEALENGDLPTQRRIEREADGDAEIEQALREIRLGLIDEAMGQG